MPLTCWAGLCAPALGPDGAPGWDSGLLELMSNWGSAETGSEVSGRAGLGGRGGWRLSRRRPRRPAGRARQRGRGWTPEQAVRLERGKTGWNRGTGRVEEREKLDARGAGLAETPVAFPRGQRSLVSRCLWTPECLRGSVSLPGSAGRSSVKSRDGEGLGHLRTHRDEKVPSLEVQLQRYHCSACDLLLSLFWSVPREGAHPGRDCCKGAENLKTVGSPPPGAVLQSYIPRPFRNPVACTFLMPATPTNHARRG